MALTLKFKRRQKNKEISELST